MSSMSVPFAAGAFLAVRRIGFGRCFIIFTDLAGDFTFPVTVDTSNSSSLFTISRTISGFFK